MVMKKVLSCVMFAWAVFLFCPHASQAQQKKGDKEIIGSSGSGFGISFGGGSRPRSTEGQTFSNSISSQNFNITGDLGYFLTRRNEVGGGIGLFVDHFKSCLRTFMDGQLINENCFSDANVGLGLDAFYRYNIAKADAKGFPFVGITVSVANISTNFTGNFRARPHVGYKYFLKRNVALDVSVGYRFDINKVNEDTFFIQDRTKTIDGRLGLSFVF